jgi:hypothetical protein
MHPLKRKVRGQKRKVNKLKKNLAEIGNFFPEESYVNAPYYNYHLPCSQRLLDSKNSSNKIRKTAMQLLIDAAVRLRKVRPSNLADKKIVVAIYLPHLWDSQIIIFYDLEYYENFFNRNTDSQRWTPIKNTKSILDNYALDCPKDFKALGFNEEINDGDFHAKNEIWCIGEI